MVTPVSFSPLITAQLIGAAPRYCGRRAAFDKTKKMYTYYISLRNKADNKKAIDANRDKLHKLQKEALDNNPGLKKYKEEHFTFRFVYHSAKNPKEVLLDDTFKY